ncbi:hypothetical protein MTO96_002332 [Rhipicephalus appendiculatus]
MRRLLRSSPATSSNPKRDMTSRPPVLPASAGGATSGAWLEPETARSELRRQSGSSAPSGERCRAPPSF